MQYVGDNVEFLDRAFRGLLQYLDVVRPIVEGSAAEARATVATAAKKLRLDFVLEEAPRALASSKEGVGRVSEIVRALKAFAHVDHGEAVAADLNRTLADTLIVAQSEYKHIARVETSYGDIPTVQCHVGKLNQVFLNLVVNAAHAIEDAGRAGQGLIRVGSRAVEDGVEITITDNGCGIATDIQHRVFDQFFTTKAMGRGTGQGLSLARGIVVDMHRGTLGFETNVGVGTRFIIRLPVSPPVLP
jgi:signal transduction histidine kinase